jgi:hypothetical protein
MKLRFALVALLISILCISCSSAPEPAADVAAQEPQLAVETAEPQDEPTVVVAPTLEPTPNPPRVVLYEDDFSDPESGWEHYREVDGILDYEDDAYRVQVNGFPHMFWVNAGVDLEDVIIEVEAEVQPGIEKNQYGVICRLDEEFDYYALFISSEGEYGIGYMKDWVLTLLGPGELAFSEAIVQGEASNQITAACVGETLSLSVNGVELLSVEDTRLTHGDTGLTVGTVDEPGADVLFDNYVLFEP